MGLACLAPNGQCLFAAVEGPQHLTDMGGDFGIGFLRIGSAQRGQSLLAPALAKQYPALAVEDEGSSGASDKALSINCAASSRRRLRSASE